MPIWIFKNKYHNIDVLDIIMYTCNSYFLLLPYSQGITTAGSSARLIWQSFNTGHPSWHKPKGICVSSWDGTWDLSLVLRMFKPLLKYNMWVTLERENNFAAKWFTNPLASKHEHTAHLHAACSAVVCTLLHVLQGAQLSQRIFFYIQTYQRTVSYIRSAVGMGACLAASLSGSAVHCGPHFVTFHWYLRK